MLFFKFSIALLAPLAVLAVPVPSGTDASQGKPQTLIAIPGQSMPLPLTTQTDYLSCSSGDHLHVLYVLKHNKYMFMLIMSILFTHSFVFAGVSYDPITYSCHQSKSLQLPHLRMRAYLTKFSRPSAQGCSVYFLVLRCGHAACIEVKKLQQSVL
jgi:hypothetical protein